MSGVKLTDIVEKMNLKNLTPEVDITEREVLVPDVNRPALQLAGFFDHFDLNRVQIIGNVECAYLETLEEEKRVEIYQKLLEHKVPCIIFSNELQPDESFIEIAQKNDIPVFGTCKKTSSFMGELIRWLNVKLAPCISIHGVLVDVYGVGVLIMGESGIGKSEAALELIKRGHRLVTDDVVEIRKVSDDTLVGSAPDITRHFIELRGIGIVDVKSMFGVQSVRETQNIDLVITLEDWSREKEYDRLGLEEEYTEFLGNRVVCHNIPIRPGRNLAIIVESAAVNHRQKQMGYNAAQELLEKLGNRKSTIIVSALSDYINAHPELQSGYSKIEVKVAPAFDRSQMERLIRSIVEEKLSELHTTETIADTSMSGTSEALEEDITKMLDNLDMFN